MDYIVLSLWVFLAWYLPKLEAGRGEASIDSPPDKGMVKNLDQVYFQLGMIHESMKQFMKAVVNFKEAIRINPRLEKAHFGIGKNYILAGRHEKAVKPLERAIKLNPDETLPFIYLGWVNNMLGNYDKAEEALKKALAFSAICPSCGIRHNKKPGEGPTAQEAVKQEVKPVNLGPVSFGNAVNEDKAEPKSQAKGKTEPLAPEEKTLKIEFEGQNLIDTKLAVTLYRYGLAHIKMEEYFPALMELTEAVRLDPEFSDAHYALGLVYERMGMQKESVAEYIIALKDKPAYHEAKFKLEEEVTLDELKRLLPDHFAPEEKPEPTHHHVLPAKILPLKRQTKAPEEGWGNAIKKQFKLHF